MFSTLAAAAPSGGGGILDTLGINFMVLGTQVVIFVITFVILSKILFGRVLGNMLRRETELEGARSSLAGDREETAKLSGEYETHMAKADKAAYAKLQELYREGMAEAGKVVAGSEKKAREEVAAAQEVIASEKDASLDALRAEVSRLTLEATSKILKVPSDPAHKKIVDAFVAEKR